MAVTNNKMTKDYQEKINLISYIRKIIKRCSEYDQMQAGFISFAQRNIKNGRNRQDREIRNLSSLVLMLNEKRSYKFGLYSYPAVNALSLMMRMSCYPQEGHLPHGRFISCFQGDREEDKSVPLVSAVSLSNFNS